MSIAEDFFFRVPEGFDYRRPRTEDEISKMIGRLTNSERGVFAVGFYRAREAIGNALARHALLTVYSHDHDELMQSMWEEAQREDGDASLIEGSFFNASYVLGDALLEVAPVRKHRSKKLVRVWRGLVLPQGSDIDEDALGLSWTTNLDVACWFACRFANPKEGRVPVVLRADVPKHCFLADLSDRNEHEVLIHPTWHDAEQILLEDCGTGQVVKGTDEIPAAAMDGWFAAYKRHSARSRAAS